MCSRGPIRVSSWLPALCWLAISACQPADGPRPVVLDRTPCAHCRMLVSDLGFAAQLQTAEGDVLDFDDPGCLLQWRAEHRPHVRATWYHHLSEDRWLRESEAGFVEVARSPMGYSLGAVDAGSAGALSATEAQSRAARGIPGTPR